MNARVPTLPTPTTLRATSTTSNRSSRWRRSSCNVARYARNCSWITCSISSARDADARGSSACGTTIGGWLTIRYRRRRARRASTAPAGCRACGPSGVLLRDLLGRLLSALLAPFFEAALAGMASELVCRQAGVPDVHRAHLGEPGHRLAVRRRPTRCRGRASAVKPLLRAAIVKLAAMRFTSYSNGPGSVSSKSLRSNSNSARARRTRRSSRGARLRRAGRSGRPSACPPDRRP